MTSSDELRSMANSVLKVRLENRGFLSAQIAEEIDFDGAPIVVVTAQFGSNANSDFASIRAARDELQDAMWKRGDERFVFVRGRYPEDDDDKDDDELEQTPGMAL